jgi:alpha-maltose-1-phosphate synthase
MEVMQRAIVTDADWGSAARPEPLIAPCPEQEVSPVTAATEKRGRLLITVAKGLGRLGGLYRELERLGWETSTVEVDDRLIRYAARVIGLRPTLAAHRRAYNRATAWLARTPLAFGYRTRSSGRTLTMRSDRVDCVLQIGGLWAPSRPPSHIPYTLFCDCTVRLGEGNRFSGVHFSSPSAAERWYRCERELYHGARKIFTASEYARRSLIDFYQVPADGVSVVGYGINLGAPEHIARDYGGQTLLFVGYEFDRKGGPLLLEAFEKVRRELPAAKLLIAGPRRVPAVVPPGVTWIGTVGREELADLYRRASLFVMPSLFEPFGLVYLEAMEWLLPCVGSANCAMSEIVLEDRTGRLVRPGDAGALAATLVELLRDPARLEQMGERGREYVRSRFPWPKVAGRVDEGLRQVVAAASASRLRARPS